jgi:hypothetical protein
MLALLWPVAWAVGIHEGMNTCNFSSAALDKRGLSSIYSARMNIID